MLEIINLFQFQTQVFLMMLLLKEVTSFKDNQYIEHGSVFNGESSTTLEGWDNPSSPYLYYGGAGLKMSDGHLVFTANGANAAGQPTVYWFAINSNVSLPKEPGEEPKRANKNQPNQRLQLHQPQQLWKCLQSQVNQKNLNHQLRQQHLSTL